MKEFTGKVAVITGGASGIGLALAHKCAAEGIHLVLADIEDGPLSQATQELEGKGVQVLAVKTDVSKAEDMERLADRAFERFGAVHLLFNNAGVGGGRSTVWESSVADWEWVLGVNVWSVIHGVRLFVPRMLAQDTEGYVVNTASLAGLVSYPGSSIYQVSKHAVVSLSEALYHELALKNAKVKVSVLCPAWVKTRIFESERNRPADQPDTAEVDPATARILAGFKQAVEHGKPPEVIADKVFEAIGEERFFILTHPASKTQIAAHGQAILNEIAPSNALVEN